ncbi:hypothetical protein D9758_003387 [Tetrapyrgos nigripes]|uniref:Protein kinase domain-containing protein n=1 Tax=Tetrapyrgos nigripes TaxID=182062 RepID=A0A8H5LW61_9AGAR|nr:hypothetical protein D9758_003387 [Tetrapyrgos nigripes]
MQPWSVRYPATLMVCPPTAFADLGLIHDLPDQALRGRVSMMQEHNAVMRRFALIASPSICAQNPDKCLNGDHSICAGRPVQYYGPLNALFDPHLATLSHKLDNLETVELTSDMVDFAGRLFSMSANLCSAENQRQVPVFELLREMFPGGSAKPGVYWPHSLIFELKNEKGSQGNPQVQAAVDYINIFCDNALSRHLWGRSNCPSVLLSLAGTELMISSVIFTDTVYLNTLYSEDLSGSFDMDKRVVRLARALQALKETFVGLSKFYTGLKTNPDPAPRGGSHLFPKPVRVEGPDDEVLLETLGLRFIKKLSRTGVQVVNAEEERAERQANMTHAIYVATSSGRCSSIPVGEVVVKFAERYNVEAHNILANANLAPKLYYHCAVLGGCTMIVMEHIQGKMALFWEIENRKMEKTVFQDIGRAINLLHENDIVFGDLRLPNIMVLQDNRAVLVDFDWAAKQGEGRYPSMLSRAIIWPQGVKEYGRMEKEHDVYMLNALRQFCKE